MKSRVKRVVLIQPKSAGGNFEYAAIPRQGMLYLSGALQQWEGPYLYEREIWFEDRSGKIDLDKDLKGVDILMVSALINEIAAWLRDWKDGKGISIRRYRNNRWRAANGPFARRGNARRQVRRHCAAGGGRHHWPAFGRFGDLQGTTSSRRHCHKIPGYYLYGQRATRCKRPDEA